jgi:hypothetical protein
MPSSEQSKSAITNRNVWQALDTWAQTLKPWQRFILYHATRNGVLDDAQIDECYNLFLENVGLKTEVDREIIQLEVTGRPDTAAPSSLRLDRIIELKGINALPVNSSLVFSPYLTIIYGRNGAGKSGFARLFANACFSRHKPDILCNIYEAVQTAPSATFHIITETLDAQALPFTIGIDHPELKRISFFDNTVALQHVSKANPFEFRPSGFDVFPEMARVYQLLNVRIEVEINSRTTDVNFANSFIGDRTEVSNFIATLNASTDIAILEKLAIYGEAENARLKEMCDQIIVLKSKSPEKQIELLSQAFSDIKTLLEKLGTLSAFFTAEQASKRSELVKKAKNMAEAARVVGSEQFRQPFFNATGSPEWLNFTKTAHALSKKESINYPTQNDYCLLCERPFDSISQKHVQALLAFVESDAQQKSRVAALAVQSEIDTIQRCNVHVFSEDSRVHAYLQKVDPALTKMVEEVVRQSATTKEQTISSLQNQTLFNGSVNVQNILDALNTLLNRIVVDLRRLQTDTTPKVIASLELERQTLRHREVLKQLLPAIKKYITDKAWCGKALSSKLVFNSRHITEKEKEMFAEIIGETYKERLSEECNKLECTLPIQLETSGQRGQTVRAIRMVGGHQPEFILSEGEQKAVALADFLTEVSLNPVNAGIVLDDPVTSQDHERKELIAERLVKEAAVRQVIIFTHDLVFLNMLLKSADVGNVEFQAHWIDRNADGKPGLVTLNDVPATTKFYDNTDRAKQCLAEARSLTGTRQNDIICKGMANLRRTIEETTAKKLFKGVIPRWEDRVMVTSLKKVNWDNSLADALVTEYERLSAYIDAHSHTDEAMGAPCELRDLEENITLVDSLIQRAKVERT